jgi:hypothetical protein
VSVASSDPPLDRDDTLTNNPNSSYGKTFLTKY